MQTDSILKVKKYNQEGDIAHEYNALRNMLDEKDEIVDFRTTEIGVDLNNPLSITCQPSYDGTVNLIINDDKNPPRIINTRITETEDNRYRIINRNQVEQTNLYKKGEVDARTRLFRNINHIPQISLRGVNHYGKLAGGNYTFYVKFADNDYNKTDVVCESGIVSVFKGSLSDIPSISGTLMDEATDKTINLTISNIDTTFSKVYLYYSRATSDLNGILVTKFYEVIRPYDIKDNRLYISLNGYEEVKEISEEELNIRYNLVTAAKTQAQVQNMLFFGNVQQTILNNKDLQNISLYIPVTLRQEATTIGYVDTNYKAKSTNDVDQNEYYNPMNIYYKLGYWPGEIYRLGIVYQMIDDSLTPVYNLRGHRFDAVGEKNFDGTSTYADLFDENGDMLYIPQDDFIEDEGFLDNTKGVFRNPDLNIINDSPSVKTVRPLYYDIQMTEDIQNALREYGIKGYFIVRQKRIPITLCQGLAIGVDRVSYTPTLFENGKSIVDGKIVDGGEGVYISESFIDKKGILTTGYDGRKIGTEYKQASGLLSVEASTNPMLQSLFDGTNYTLQKITTGQCEVDRGRMYRIVVGDSEDIDGTQIKASTVYVPTDVPLKYINNIGFSTRAGVAEEVKGIAFFGNREYGKDYRNLLRGVFTPFLGVNARLQDNSIYNVRIQNYSSVFEKEYFEIRGNDNSEFNACSDRYELGEEKTISVYRGDCYTSTVTVRMHRNFIDSETPTNETIVDPETWKKTYNGYSTTDPEKWLDINRADINAVPMGTWVTFKCLSNTNLGLRAEDRSHVEEISLMGNPRSFYPLVSASPGAANKIEESQVLNAGYGAVLGHKRNYTLTNVPYIKDLFDNRIMFSNVQIDDDFRNAYRIFQGLSYKDIDRQYGAIVRLIPWGVNLLCVFEHGLGIIPINEKALLSTNTGQAIHMYGAGVIQNQITLITPDYGSIWPESVYLTPLALYGVDTYAKKIWKYTDAKGLELISDTKVQRFLNDNILLAEKDKYTTVALKNVKTHYNNYKGDVMFTFYNEDEKALWHLCYNERIDKWVTRYSWTPLYSENINNVYYSLDKKRAEVLAYIYDNQHTEVGLRLQEGQNEWDIKNDYSADISTVGYEFYDHFKYEVKNITSSYMNGDDEKVISLSPEAVTIDTSKIYIPTSKLKTPFLGFYNLRMDGGEQVYDTVPYTTSSGRYVIDTERSKELYYKYRVIDNGLTTEPYEKVPDKDFIYATISIPNDIMMYEGHQLYYIKVAIDITPIVNIDGSDIPGSTFTQTLGIVAKRSELTPSQRVEYDLMLTNGFYVHGRAGIFDEMDYFDQDPLNNIQPTKWYDKQEPFEFEFVVNQPTGLHKIFNDLVIISNNVEPQSLEIEIVGDVYHFNKEKIFKKDNPDIQLPKIVLDDTPTNRKEYQTSVVWDNVLNQYSLRSHQDCMNINTYGRRLGNIQYVEDSWRTVIEPIYYTDNTDTDGLHTTRIRDKYAKIRVKYSGEKLAVIMAIQTLLSISYA